MNRRSTFVKAPVRMDPLVVGLTVAASVVAIVAFGLLGLVLLGDAVWMQP